MEMESIGGNELIGLLTSLIRTDTVNPPGDELQVVSILAEWLRSHGVESQIQPLSRGRANLLARVRGTGTYPALAFCGHLDTVPIGNVGWRHDPFGGEIAEGRLYGRGASDMKGGLAAMAAAMVALQHGDSQLPCDVLLLGTAGEEVDCCGARQLVEQGNLGQVGAMIIGEPTGLDIAVAHKGALWLRVTVAGRTAHGSMPQLGSNAILNTCGFLASLLSHPFEVEPHPLLGLPTVSPNLIQSGIGVNVVPDRCEAAIDIRTIPGLVHERVVQDIREVLNKSLRADDAAQSRIEVLLDRAPVSTDPAEPVIRAASEAIREILEMSPGLKGMTYFTDGSVIVPATGIPVILWGPGDPEQAHQANESIGLEPLLLASRLYERAATHYGRSLV